MKREVTDWQVDHEATYFATYWWPWLGRRPRSSVPQLGTCACGCHEPIRGKQKWATSACRQRNYRTRVTRKR